MYVYGILANYSVVWAKFPMGSFHFPKWQMFFPIDKLLKFQEIEYLNHYVKFKV